MINVCWHLDVSSPMAPQQLLDVGHSPKKLGAVSKVHRSLVNRRTLVLYSSLLLPSKQRKFGIQASTLMKNTYRVGLRAQANFSAPTFEPAHGARAGKRAALSVYLSQLQLRCSNSITGPQASSFRSELFPKWAAKNVIAFCRADRNLSSKSLARYIQSKKHKSKVLRRS